MRYGEFKDLIEKALRRRPGGVTWKDLREGLDLPYDRPCPTWRKKLEAEIGLTRRKGPGRALLWALASGPSVPAGGRGAAKPRKEGAP